MKHHLLSISITMIMNVSCSTMKDSTLLGIGVGGAVGAGMGAAVGAQTNNETKGAMTGAAVGAAIGGLMGYLDFRERSKDLKVAPSGSAIDTKGAPSLSKPEVRRVWVPARIEGDKYIQGHWLYVIDRPSIWRQE